MSVQVWVKNQGKQSLPVACRWQMPLLWSDPDQPVPAPRNGRLVAWVDDPIDQPVIGRNLAIQHEHGEAVNQRP